MLVIRRQQFEALEQAFTRRFEDEMVNHLRKFAVAHVSGIEESNLRKIINTGVERAAKYGYTLRGPVRFFIELMILHGTDFDTDPMLPWARETLPSGTGGQLARADRLYEITNRYRDAVIGAKYEKEIAAIRRLLVKPVSDWLADSLSDDWTRIRELYPEKCEHASVDAAAAIFQKARQSASEHQLSAKSGPFVVAALMVAFGHGCLTDLQFPWIAKSLHDMMGQHPEKRAEKLAVRAVTYLSEALIELERG